MAAYSGFNLQSSFDDVLFLPQDYLLLHSVVIPQFLVLKVTRVSSILGSTMGAV